MLDSCRTGGSGLACAWLVEGSVGLRQSDGSVGGGEARVSAVGLCVRPCWVRHRRSSSLSGVPSRALRNEENFD